MRGTTVTTGTLVGGGLLVVAVAGPAVSVVVPAEGWEARFEAVVDAGDP